jgi:hypothetical protein
MNTIVVKIGCSVLMHLKLHTDSQKCSLYVNEIEHDHTNHIYNEEYNLPHKSKALELMSSSLISSSNRYCSAVQIDDIVADDNVADNNDDDDIIIEKFVGGKLGKTVKVGKTRMSKGFYQYAREKIKIKKEKELILESESTGRLTRSKKSKIS